MISRHGALFSHIVTFVDPYKGDDLPFSQTLYSRKLQEMLVALYRAELRGFPHLKIKSLIPKDFEATAESEIPRLPAETLRAFFANYMRRS